MLPQIIKSPYAALHPPLTKASAEMEGASSCRSFPRPLGRAAPASRVTLDPILRLWPARASRATVAFTEAPVAEAAAAAPLPRAVGGPIVHSQRACRRSRSASGSTAYSNERAAAAVAGGPVVAGAAAGRSRAARQGQRPLPQQQPSPGAARDAGAGASSSAGSRAPRRSAGVFGAPPRRSGGGLAPREAEAPAGIPIEGPSDEMARLEADMETLDLLEQELSRINTSGAANSGSGADL
jgi:hypothetical protein